METLVYQSFIFMKNNQLYGELSRYSDEVEDDIFDHSIKLI